MSAKIVVTIQGRSLTGELYDGPAAAQLQSTLPRTVRMSRWGEEYYGTCPLDLAGGPSAREIMEPGEIAYWPPGKALCFFFGPTPASTDHRPRAASPVVPLGRLDGEGAALKEHGSGIEAEIRLQEP